MTVHATVVDTSLASGSLACCMCGWTSGPYSDRLSAQRAAREHRKATAPIQPRIRTDEEAARLAARQRERRAEQRRQRKARTTE